MPEPAGLPPAPAGLQWTAMKQLDLDDLPPRAAQLLAGLEAGETLTLVQNGLVVGRLEGAAPPEAQAGAAEDAETGPAPAGEARAAEIFEHFRSLMEDDF
jgi:antitoxin (DNA-binding transcriptional repressor) of toxin-antitoxin stability system